LNVPFNANKYTDTRQILSRLQEHTKLEKIQGSQILPATRKPKGSTLFQQAEQCEFIQFPKIITYIDFVQCVKSWIALVVDRRMAVRRIHWIGNCFWGDR
jgi:hypothetical protein